MSLTIHRQKHPKLSVEGLEQWQMQQSASNCQVQVLTDDCSKELPLILVAVQDDHSSLLRYLPKNAESGSLDARRAGLGDTKHCKLAANSTLNKMANPGHLLRRLLHGQPRPPIFVWRRGRCVRIEQHCGGVCLLAFFLLLLVSWIADVDIRLAIHKDEHGVTRLAFVDNLVPGHENSVQGCSAQLLDEIRTRVAEERRLLQHAHELCHRATPRICNTEDVHPLIWKKLESSDHNALMKNLAGAVLRRHH
mmetsp:Transcript_44807/g.80536  ORF Transcript_44807/g.80536 Transcript_44807/m.80536 type:complete len:250 (-) Transcript_44807:1424-2173(-)